jgi:hypothetical protein
LSGEYQEKGWKMYGTLEQLRDCHPGMWLLIRLDGPEAETGTTLVTHEDPNVVYEQMSEYLRPSESAEQPLYVTYSIAKGEELPNIAL